MNDTIPAAADTAKTGAENLQSLADVNMNVAEKSTSAGNSGTTNSDTNNTIIHLDQATLSSSRGVALTKPSEPCGNRGQDNANGDLIVYVQDVLRDETKGKRQIEEYHVEGSLGEGAYGVVCRCTKRHAISDSVLRSESKDTTKVSKKNMFAVKVIKNRPAYHNAALNEVRILQVIQARLGSKCRSIINLETSFVHQHHLCLVFEVLGINLYEMLMQNQFRGLPMDLLRAILTQLLEATSQLHSLQIIHCDLKPENILLKSSENPLKSTSATSNTSNTNSTTGTQNNSNNENNHSGTKQRNAAAAGNHISSSCDIKVIDLGSACFDGQTLYPYIQSRFYRAPEVVLGVPYDNAIDIWSIGCIVAELFVGLPLFPGVSEHAQLARIMDMFQDYPPLWMLHCGKGTSKMFHRQKDIDVAAAASPKLLTRKDSGSGSGRGINPLTGGAPKVCKQRWSTLKRPPQHKRERGQHIGEKCSHPYVFKTPEEYQRDNQKPNVDEYKTYFRYTSLEDIIMYYTMPKGSNFAEILKTRTKRCALVDLLRRLLCVDPTRRLTASQALSHPFLTGVLEKNQPGTSSLEDVVQRLSCWEPPKDLTRIMRKRSLQKKLDACEQDIFDDVFLSSNEIQTSPTSSSSTNGGGQGGNQEKGSNQQQKGRSYRASAPRKISTGGGGGGGGGGGPTYNHLEPSFSSSLPNYTSTSPMAGMTHVLSGQWSPGTSFMTSPQMMPPPLALSSETPIANHSMAVPAPSHTSLHGGTSLLFQQQHPHQHQYPHQHQHQHQNQHNQHQASTLFNQPPHAMQYPPSNHLQPAIGSFPPPFQGNGVTPTFGGMHSSLDNSSGYWGPQTQYLSPEPPPDSFAPTTIQQQQQQQQHVHAQQQYMQRQHTTGNGFSSSLGSSISSAPYNAHLPVIREAATEQSGSSATRDGQGSKGGSGGGGDGGGGDSSTPLPEQMRRAQLAIGEIQRTMERSMHLNDQFPKNSNMMFQVVRSSSLLYF